MPISNDATGLRRCSALQRLHALRAVAITLAIPLWLGACSPITDETMAPSAGVSPQTTVEPAPAPSGPPGPVVLAPSMTGERLLPPTAPTRSAAPQPAPAAALPPPTPVAAEATPPPAPPAVPKPAAAAAITPPPAPPPVPISCPPGSSAMWSEPDVVGAAVPICHRLNAPRY